jgi:hypothetical protein
MKDDDIPRLGKALSDVVLAYEALGPLAEDHRSYDSLLEVSPVDDS